MKLRRPWLAGAFVALAVLLVFSPVVKNGFVDWDDDILIYANPYIQGLDFLHLRWMLTSTLNSAWQPLGWLTYAIIYKLFALKAWAFHWQSLKLHALGAVLVYALGLELLGGEPIVAALSALLFAVHPLQVESVAWASCLADVLCCVLTLGAFLAYLKSFKKLSYTLAVLAAFARWEVVTLFPLVLIHDALFIKKKTSWKDEIPFLLVSMGAGAANAIAKASVMHYESVPHAPGTAALAAVSLLGHVVLPAWLRPVYFITPDSHPFGFGIASAVAFLLAVTALAIVLRKKYPAVLAVWLSCLAVIAPVVSMSRPGPIFVHDRYAYLLLAVLALGIGGILKKRRNLRPVAGVLIVLLAAASVQRIKAWRDAETLWKSVIATDPEESLAYYNVGNLLWAKGKPYEAIYYLREQARRNPEKGRANLAHAWNDLGTAYFELSKLGQAERCLTNALIYAPNEPQIKTNLAEVRRKLRGR